jgi:transposase IS4-like protein
MPRAGQTKPPLAPRLPDRIAIGVLTKTFPPELVDRVTARTGRGEQRRRLLPARMVVYYTLAMSLFARWATRRSCGCWSTGWPGCGAGEAIGRCHGSVLFEQ